MGDIDITDLVAALQSSFVTWAVSFIYGLTIAQPLFSWLALPIISSIYQMILKGIFAWLAGAAAMQGFFLNTALKKSGQAGDFVAAVNFKLNLPPNVTEEAYARAEQAEISAFNSFVRIA